MQGDNRLNVEDVLCAVERSNVEVVLFWNGTLIRSAMGFCASSAAVEATAGRQQCGEAERLCRTSYNRNFIQ